jgi:hypothetical protein
LSDATNIIWENFLAVATNPDKSRAPLIPEEVREIMNFVQSRANMKIIRDESGMGVTITRGDQTIMIRNPRVILNVIRKLKETEEA